MILPAPAPAPASAAAPAPAATARVADGRRLRHAATPPVLALAFALPAAVALLLLAVLVPPFENSDEFNHLYRAEQVASGTMIARHFAGPATSGGRVDLGIGRVDDIIGVIRFHPDRKVTGAMLSAASRVRWGERGTASFANTAIYAPLLYLPAVLGVLVGKGLGLTVVASLDLARLLAGAAAIGAAAAAIALAGEAAPLLLVVLSLPMSLSLFAAVNQDGAMIAACGIAVAALARLAAGGAARAPLVFVLAAALALPCVGRPAYLPLAGLPLLVPRVRLAVRAAAALLVLVASGGWSLLAAHFSMMNGSAARGVLPQAQLAFLLHHPGDWPALALHSFTEHQGMEGLSFFREMVGVLGWIDVTLPPLFYGLAGAALALALAATCLGGRPLLPARAQAIAFVAFGASIALVFVLLYLTWTPVGGPWVDGVQGRYFLPLAALLPVLLPAIAAPRALRTALTLPLMAFPTLSAAVAVYAVVRRYYI